MWMLTFPAEEFLECCSQIFSAYHVDTPDTTVRLVILQLLQKKVLIVKSLIQKVISKKGDIMMD